MKCEVTLIFEETDGTLKWLFDIITYAHHISEPPIRKLLEPMLKEFLHEKSYIQIMKLANAQIPEAELVQTHLYNGLIRFNKPTIHVRGAKIKAVCYMIEQAGSMQAAAKGEDVPEYILSLFRGHEIILKRMQDVISEALITAGAKGLKIDKFSSQ